MSQIICSNCQNTNRLGAKFCFGCGQPLPSQPQMNWQTYPPNLGTGMLSTNSMVNNRYLIIQKVGQGGMGAVYKITDTQRHGQVLALKEMSASAVDPVDRPQMINQFNQEAELLRRLNHPNLPFVTDKFSIEDRHYLVMEFIDGSTLQETLNQTKTPFPESLVIHWTSQLCNVLDYLHHQNPPIIFRDLKPDNIMVTTDNNVKLIDFGIVRFFKPGKKKDTITLGTKGYAAPEQFGSGQTDERSDVYSLGATLFHLLTAVDPETYLFKIPSVRQFNGTVSPKMDNIVSQATRYEPKDRYHSVQDISKELPEAPQPDPISSPIFNSIPMNIPGTSHHQTARPTTRLVQATVKLTAQWTNKQLALAGTGLLLLILAIAWIITPMLMGTWFWYNVPSIAILAPIIFAATRRRGLAGIGHGIAALVAGGLIWFRAGIDESIFGLLAGAFISAIAIEVMLLILPKFTKGSKRDDPGTWKREIFWLGLTATVGYIFLATIALSASQVYWLTSVFFAFLLGGLGWFIGDLIYSSWLLKRSDF